MNRIQFQPGLSLPEFLKLFGTEALYSQALERTRWPEGFFAVRSAVVVRTASCVTAPTRFSNAMPVDIKLR